MRIEGVLFFGYFHTGESVSLERKIESSIFLCLPRDLNILGKSCTTFVIVKIVRNLSRGRSPCQRVNHVKSGVIYFSAFIYSRIRYYSYVEPGPNIPGSLQLWNKECFGNIFRSKIRLRARLEGIQKQLSSNHSDHLLKLEIKLHQEL